MAVTEERLEYEVHRAYIRGAMAAMELLQEAVTETADYLNAELLGKEFKSYCDGYPKCKGCRYLDGATDDDCFALFVEDWRAKNGNDK